MATTHRMQPIGDALRTAQGTPMAKDGAFWKALEHAAGPQGRVQVLPNAHLPDDFHFAKGVVVALPVSAPLPLDVLNHDRALSAVAMVKLPDTFDAEAAKKRLGHVRTVLQNRAAAAPARFDALLDSSGDLTTIGDSYDVAHWEPTLGARGVLAIARLNHTDEFGLGENDSYDHYLVYAGAPETLLAEMYGKMRATPHDERPSIGAFVASPAWRAVEKAVERNACGVLAVAAEELNVPIATRPDPASCYAAQSDVEAPHLAVPDHLQLNGGFEALPVGSVPDTDETYIAALAGATSTKRACNGRLVLCLGPRHGFAAYPVDDTRAPAFWPVGPRRSSANASAALPAKVLAQYADVSAHADAAHPRLQPERYEAPSRAFHEALTTLGWARIQGRQHFELCAGIVSPLTQKTVAEPLPIQDLTANVRAGSVVA